MTEQQAINWAIHHMVVDYYHKLLTAIRKNIQVPKLRFEDFLPIAQERVEALLPHILEKDMSCKVEAQKLLSWTCREHAEIEIINKVQALNHRENNE